MQFYKNIYRYMRHTIMGIVLIVLVCSVYANAWQDPNTGYVWTYRINGEEAEIFGTWKEGTGYVPTISPKVSGSVVIPELLLNKQVSSIGEYAFHGCSSITQITIPTSVRSIGLDSFMYCSGLRHVTIPSSVTNIGPRAFMDCDGMISVTISDNINSIQGGMFSGCNNLQDVIIPDNVKHIGDSAFYGCSSLSNITIGTSVTNIGVRAFSGCNKLKSVIIPDNVTQIGYNTFCGCSSLSNITIGVHVTNISASAFRDGIVEGAEIYFKGNAPHVSSAHDFFGTVFPLRSTIIVSRNSTGWGNVPGKWRQIPVVYSTNIIRFDANGGDCMEHEREVGRNQEIGQLPIPEKLGHTFDYWDAPYSSDCRIRIFPSTIVSTDVTVCAQWVINAYAVTFDSNGGIGGQSVFQEYGSKLVPPTVSRTGYTFKGWSPSVAATVPANDVTYTAQWEINKYNVVFDANGGVGGTRDQQNFGSAMVAPTVTRTGYTFTGWSPTVAATVPANDVTYTAQWKVNQYTATFNVNGGDGGTAKTQDYGTSLSAPTVTRMGYTFTGWSPSVPSTMPAANTTYTAQWKINQYNVVFDANGGVGGTSGKQVYDSDIAVPTVTRERHDFIGWAPDVDARVPAHDALYVAQWRRWGDTISASKMGGKTMKELYPQDYAYMTDVILEEGVTELPEGFFDGCGNVERLTLPDSLETLGYDDLPTKIKAKLSYGDDGFMVYDGWVLGYVDNEVSVLELPTTVCGVGTRAFAEFYELQTVTIPHNIRKIGCEAFKDCSYLDNVKIPDSVTFVGRGAFAGCSYMQTVSLGAGVRKIGDLAFARCANLQAVVIPSGVETIGAQAFFNDWRMLSVSIPHSVTNVGESAFVGCKNLTGVTVPAAVGTMAYLFPDAYSGKIDTVAVADGETDIMDNMFSGCKALANFVWSGTETNVGSRAFAECVSLREIVVPHSVRRMGESVFSGCTSLAEVSLSHNLAAIPDLAFNDCSSLDSLIIPPAVTNIGSRFFDSSTVSIYYLGSMAPGCSPAAYSSAADSCVSYVVQGSRGWDGPGSRVLPELWNDHAITYWTPNQFDVAFDANGGRFDVSGGSTWSEQQITDTGYSLPSTEPVRPGWAFDGWWTEPVNGAQIKISTRVTLTREHTIYAHWRYLGERMTVTFNANGGTAVVPETQEYVPGQTFGQFPVPTRRGYNFTGWYTTARAGVIDSLVVISNTTLYAQWVEDPVVYSTVQPDVVDQYEGTDKVWTVTFDAQGGMIEDENRIFTDKWILTVERGKTLNALPVPVWQGRVFIGWSSAYAPDLGLVTEAMQVPASDMELFARWVPVVYYVRFNANGGTGIMTNQVFRYDSPQNLKTHAFARKGFAFSGWATTPEGQVRYAENARVVNLEEVQGRIVDLYAVWSGAGYSVRFDSNGGEGFMDNQTIAIGETQNLWPNVYTRQGYVFAGWAVSTTDAEEGKVTYRDGEEVKDLATANGVDVPLYAVWEEENRTVRISFDANGGSVSPDYWDCVVGTAVEAFQLPTRPGFTFDGWWTAKTGGTQVTSIARVTSAQTFYAHWTENGNVDPGDGSYIVTFNANGGSVTETKRTVAGVAAVGDLPMPMRTGYTFAGWFTAAEGGVQVFATTVVSSSVTYYAQWSQVMYTVTFNANGGTGGTTRSVTSGAVVGTLPVPTRTGYTFAGWWTDVSGGTLVSASAVVTANVTYYAHWTENGGGGGSGGGDTPSPTTFTVTFNANGGDGGWTKSMDYGAAISAPTVTRTGYAFTGWTPAVAATVSAGSVTYTAQWKVNQYTVTFDANGGDGGKTVTQDYGTALAAPAVTRTGYTFVGWSPAVPAKVPAANASYIAQWTKNQYTVTFNANGGTGGWSRSMEYGAAIIAPTVMRTGYTFKCWTPAVAATVPVGGAAYTAQWTINRHQVRLVLNGGEGVGSVTVDYGTRVDDLPVPYREGYEFVGWFTAPTGGRRIADDVIVTGDLTLYAQWQRVLPELYEMIDGAAPGAVASEYNGYLFDDDGNMKGTIQAKVGKPNKKTGLATIKATVQLGAKKVTLKAVGKGSVQIAADGPTEIELVGGEECVIVLGADGLAGGYGAYAIDGARNFFTSKDKAELAAANAVLGNWLGGVSILADAGNFTVTISAKGKAKVSGTLANGKKATGNAVFLIGEEWACVPVVLPKANISFALWFPLDGGEVVVSGLGDDVVAGRGGALKAGAAFRIDEDEFFAVTGIDALPYLPDGVSVEPKGAKWVVAGGAKAGKVMYLRGTQEVDETKLGENPSGLKLTYKKADGSFKGSFKAYADVKGKLKATTVSVSGIVLNGVGYGTATVKGKGSVPVTIE